MPKLKFTWKLNTATKNDPDDYYPKVREIEYVTEDQLINDIAIPGSILKETELRAVLLRVFQQLVNYMKESRGFKNQFIVIKPGLNGKAYSDNEQWDDDKHNKYASALLGAPFQAAAQEMELEWVSDTKEAPVIEEVYDRKSKTTNQKLTPGHTIKISGSQLKIHTHVAGQGLFLVNQTSGIEHPVELEENYPSQLRADVPDNLPIGSYQLKITNTKTSVTKTLRTTIFEVPLTVE